MSGLEGKRTKEGFEICLLNEPVVGGREATLVEEGGLTIGEDLEVDPVGLGAAPFDAEDILRCRSENHRLNYTAMGDSGR